MILDPQLKIEKNIEIMEIISPANLFYIGLKILANSLFLQGRGQMGWISQVIVWKIMTIIDLANIFSSRD